MDLKDASKLYIRGDRSPEVIATIKSGSDNFKRVWYDSIEDHLPITIRYKFAEAMLRHREPKGRLLEVGSWTGVFASRYKMWGYDVTCVDGCFAASRITCDLGADRSYYVHIDDAIITEKYDVVCAFEILEHLVDPDSVVAKLKSAVKPGGIFLVTVPTEDSVFEGKTALEYEGGEHINAITKPMLESWGFNRVDSWEESPNHAWYLAYQYQM